MLTFQKSFLGTGNTMSIGYNDAFQQELQKIKENRQETNEIALNWYNKKYILQFAQALSFNSTIVELNLDNCAIDNEQAISVAKALRDNHSIRKLSLQFNNIGDEGIMAIMDSLNNSSSIQEIKVGYNRIGDKGASYIAKFFVPDNHKKYQSILKSYVGDEAALYFTHYLIKMKLEVLNLSSNMIGDVGAGALATALAQNSTLKRLYLQHVGITATGIQVLADSLTRNTTLEQLILSFTQVGDNGTALLVNALRKNSTYDLISTKAFCSANVHFTCRNKNINWNTAPGNATF